MNDRQKIEEFTNELLNEFDVANRGLASAILSKRSGYTLDAFWKSLFPITLMDYPATEARFLTMLAKNPESYEAKAKTFLSRYMGKESHPTTKARKDFIKMMDDKYFKKQMPGKEHLCADTHGGDILFQEVVNNMRQVDKWGTFSRELTLELLSKSHSPTAMTGEW